MDQGPRARRLRSRLLVATAAATVVASCGGADNAHWDAPDSPSSDVAPSLIATNAQLLMAVTGTDATIHVAGSPTPGAWTAWQAVGPDEAGQFEPSTPPVLIPRGSETSVVARGADDNLYLSEIAADRSSSPWVQLTQDGSVATRFAATSTDHEVHVAHPTSAGCLVARFGQGGPLGTSTIADCVDVTIAADGPDRVVIAARSPNRVRVLVADRASAWAMEEIGRVSRTTHSLSSVVRLDDAYHVIVTEERLVDDVSGSTQHRLLHLGFPVEAGRTLLRVVADYSPSEVGEHALPAITAYRGRLLAIWTTPHGDVRAARWDVAAGLRPWVDAGKVGSGSDRPQLVARNYRAGITIQQAQLPGFGNDAFAAVLAVDDDGEPAGARALNLSRDLMRRDIRRNLRLRDANAPVCMDAGADCPPDDPPVISDLQSEDRAVVSEIGFASWMFPADLVDGLYPSLVGALCEDGTWDPDKGGCISPYRLGVYVKGGGGLFNYRGAWINADSDHLQVWEELGHYFAPALGFGTSRTPDQGAADRSGIDLAVLKTGRKIFAQQAPSGCIAAGPRCAGFTGHAGNYDTNGVEHSFIYAVHYYIAEADLLRQFIADDLATGDTLLQRKYQWIRANIFGGVEF
jgi:hypothetical protein